MHPGFHAERAPEKPAYVMARSGRTVSYAELNEKSNQGAQLFRSLGLGPGDHIALCMENNEHFFQICWAAQRSGLYYTCISSRLSPPEVAYIVDDCDAKVFIGSKATREGTASLREACPKLRARYLVGDAGEGFENWEAALAEQPTVPIEDEALGAPMFYSSGTTGRPKGVKRALEVGRLDEPLAELLEWMDIYQVSEESIYLSPAPLYHSAPNEFSMGFLTLGATVIVMESFDAREALSLIEKYRATHSQWVPTMFIRMLRLPEEDCARFDLSSMTCAIHASAPCPIHVKEQMIEWWGPVLHEYYAGTEGWGSTIINSQEWLEHKGSVGRPMGCAIHILADETDEELPAGEVGGVYFESDIGSEYHKAPEKTEGARSKQGYTTLGDVGYLDEDGWLFLTDRKAFMIISGGVNIYPQETEDCLISHPKVVDVAVIGVPNEEFGEEVKAIVQPVDIAAAGSDLVEELMAWCRDRISHVKCPRSIDFRPELPRHATGKLYKRLLKDEYWGRAGSTVV